MPPSDLNEPNRFRTILVRHSSSELMSRISSSLAFQSRKIYAISSSRTKRRPEPEYKHVPLKPRLLIEPIPQSRNCTLPLGARVIQTPQDQTPQKPRQQFTHVGHHPTFFLSLVPPIGDTASVISPSSSKPYFVQPCSNSPKHASNNPNHHLTAPSSGR
jgi:hypothetical protein